MPGFPHRAIPNPEWEARLDKNGKEAARRRHAQEHAQDDAVVLKDIVPPTINNAFENIFRDSDSGNFYFRSNRNRNDPNRRRIEHCY